MTIPQGNPTLDKMAQRMGLAGAGFLGPILKGLGGRIQITYESVDSLSQVRIYDNYGFNSVLTADGVDVNEDGTKTWYKDIVFGVDTPYGETGGKSRRCFLEWSVIHTVNTDESETSTFKREFYVKDLPAKGSIYLAGQEAQIGEAFCFIEEGGSGLSANASFSINILPVFSDEFFSQHEYYKNRYANTLRNWGGAATVEIFSGNTLGDPIISEMDIKDLHGYYWENPGYGRKRLIVRLRSSVGSPNYVTFSGYIRFKQFQT